MRPSLEQLIGEAQAALSKLDARTGDVARFACEFEATVGEIGRRLVTQPERASDVRAFVERTAERLVVTTPVWLWVQAVYEASEPINSEPEP